MDVSNMCCNFSYEFFLVCILHVDFSCFFFFNDTATTEIYTLSLHDALPISGGWHQRSSTLAGRDLAASRKALLGSRRSEEHTSELQSQSNLVCRLLLEKKKKILHDHDYIISESLRNDHLYNVIRYVDLLHVC